MTATPTSVSPTSVATRTMQPAVVLVRSSLAVPFALYLFAVAVGLAAAVTVVFPTNEGSAYYLAVARNLAEGRGLVIDTMWSYATPPLVLPRPAFELWQPLASLIAAVPMAIFGTSFLMGQLGGVLVGATIAPLTWAITRDSAPHVGTPTERVDHLAVGSGIVVSLLAPFLLAVAVPDSTLPFMVFGTLACWLAPRALDRGWRWGLALGVALGLAYLARYEAIYIGLLVVTAAVVGRRGAMKTAMRRLAPVLVGGLVVVGPWLLRNVAVFGTAFPGQAIDNALLTYNEQIFNYSSRPTLAGFLAQGPGQIVGHIAAAAAHNVIDVALVAGAPVTAIGAVAALVLARRRGIGRTPLGYLLGSGLLTLLVATVVFPVASMWGTFLHSAGPLMVGLTICAVVATDRVVDSIRRRRAWERRNAWLAPAALALLTIPMTALQLTILGGGRITELSANSVGAYLLDQPEAQAGARPVIITDHPMWLNFASGLPTLKLPLEAPDVVLRLARDHAATLVVLNEQYGPYPAALRAGPLASCFVERPPPAFVANITRVFSIAEECR